jgi:YjzC-like protein
MKTYKPGQKVQRSGLYQELDANSNPIDADQATCTKGEPFPPTNTKGHRWTLVEQTPHREPIVSEFVKDFVQCRSYEAREALAKLKRDRLTATPEAIVADWLQRVSVGYPNLAADLVDRYSIARMPRSRRLHRYDWEFPALHIDQLFVLWVYGDFLCAAMFDGVVLGNRVATIPIEPGEPEVADLLVIQMFESIGLGVPE